MRLSEPRIAPLEADQWDADAQQLMQPFVKQGRIFNIFKTLVNHPSLAKRWMVFANHVLGKSTLAVRERELVILRIGFLCQADYEWGQHVQIARQAGMTDDEIRSCQTGPETAGLSEVDRLLFQSLGQCQISQPGKPSSNCTPKLLSAILTKLYRPTVKTMSMSCC